MQLKCSSQTISLIFDTLSVAKNGLKNSATVQYHESSQKGLDNFSSLLFVLAKKEFSQVSSESGILALL